jgi:hypothetical protein
MLLRSRKFWPFHHDCAKSLDQDMYYQQISGIWKIVKKNGWIVCNLV